MENTASAIDPSRRAFLIGMCGAAAIAGTGLGTTLLADDAWAAPGIKRKKNGKVVVSVDKVAELQQAQPCQCVLLGNVKGTPVAVIREGDDYSALNLRCTHQGATVDEVGDGWQCPLHGSKFAKDGELERGPAMKNLAPYPSRWRAKKRKLVVG